MMRMNAIALVNSGARRFTRGKKKRRWLGNSRGFTTRKLASDETCSCVVVHFSFLDSLYGHWEVGRRPIRYSDLGVAATFRAVAQRDLVPRTALHRRPVGRQRDQVIADSGDLLDQVLA